MKICLCMIVKDEAHVIRRCLESVRDQVDCYVILDTGSTDQTVEIVRNCLKGLPGELRQVAWKNFGHNRTQALELARELPADYLLVMDADDVLQGEIPESLDKDCYSCRISSNGLVYRQVRLLRNALPWRYAGAVHEVPVCDQVTTCGELEVTIEHRADGSSWQMQAEKYRRYASLLEEEIESQGQERPEPRVVFYLAQCFRDAGELERALAAYRQRIELGGWTEEMWYSALQAGSMLEKLDRREEAVSAYLQACELKPHRAEPLFELCRLYRQQDRFELSYLFGRRALELSPDEKALFVHSAAYGPALWDELSISAYYLGKHQEALQLCERALAGRQDDRLIENRAFMLAAASPEARSERAFAFFDSRIFPRFLQFETNTKCNARCRMCPHPLLKEREPAGERLMDSLAGCLSLVEEVCPFLYQEPTLEPRLISILSRLKELNPAVRTTVYSNMAAMTPEKARALIDCGHLDSLNISFYGPTPELYRKWQPPLDWIQTRQNIRYLVDYRNPTRARTRISMHYLAVPELLQHYQSFRREWGGVVDAIGLVHFDTFCGMFEDLGSDCWGPKAQKRMPCPRLWNTFNVLCNGDVVPCCLDHSGKEVWGNVLQQSPLEIWRGERAKTLRRMHIEGRFQEIELCRECNVWEHRHAAGWQELW